MRRMVLHNNDVDIHLKKKDKPGHKSKSIVSLPCLVLAAICVGSSWFIYKGYIAGLAAFRSIQRSEDYSAVVEPSSHRDEVGGDRSARVLHLDFYGGGKPTTSSQGEVVSNFCDDVEFDADWHDHLSSLGDKSMLPTSIHENVNVSGLVPLEQYHYYQVCVATHPTHHHKVVINLSCQANGELNKHVAVPHIFYNADLYLSVDYPHPTVEHSTWISNDHGSDTIAVSTYLDDFVRAPSTPSGRGKVLYVGVFGREVLIDGVRDVTTEGIPYTLSVTVSNTARNSNSGSRLRGGNLVGG
jgi:hypothetical protein